MTGAHRAARPAPHARVPRGAERAAAEPRARLHVLGVAGGRRVRLFTEAAARAGVQVSVLDWSEALTLAERGEQPPWPRGALVHVDSTGEDQQVEARLRSRAGFTRDLAPGEIGGWAEQSRGLLELLEWADSAAGVRLDTTAADVRDLFAKPRTRERLTHHAVPMPSPGPAAAEVTMHPGRWFVKPTHGSSASGVVALQVARDRIEAWAPIEVDGQRLFNNLRVRRYVGAEVPRLLELLGAGGELVCERWYPKASAGGLGVDLRVVVVGGAARIVVARGSRGPMTNLHLGNQRVPLEVTRTAAGALWPRLLELAERAAGCFPDTRCVGVDVLPRAGWRAAVVGEVNAFGDLVPGALCEGGDSHDWQVRDLLTPTSRGEDGAPPRPA